MPTLQTCPFDSILRAGKRFIQSLGFQPSPGDVNVSLVEPIVVEPLCCETAAVSEDDRRIGMKNKKEEGRRHRMLKDEGLTLHAQPDRADEDERLASTLSKSTS